MGEVVIEVVVTEGENTSTPSIEVSVSSPRDTWSSSMSLGREHTSGEATEMSTSFVGGATEGDVAGTSMFPCGEGKEGTRGNVTGMALSLGVIAEKSLSSIKGLYPSKSYGSEDAGTVGREGGGG